MKTQVIFLLLYSGALNIGIPCAAQPDLCVSSDGPPQLNCTMPPDPAADFLMCVGIPEGPGAGDLHMLNLKGLIEAVLDIYSFMRSSVRGVPVLELFGAVQVSWTSLLQNQDFLQFWLEIRLTPLLSSVSQQFLTCLSNSDFDCNTYQTVVHQLSQHYSGMDPVRQKWIYTFFMYPFLSRNSSAGCVDPDGTTEDWLIKNFGSFSVMGQIRDFTAINLNFSGLDALNVLTPQQQADLLLNPGLGGVDNASLSIVMESLLNSVLPPGGGGTLTPNGSMWTTDLPMYLPSPQDPVTQAMNGFMTAFLPIRSFVREFVSLSHQPDLSSAVFVQGMLNWTLAELAAPYKQNISDVQTKPVLFDPTDVNAWFTHVVTPVLQRFLPGDIPSDIIAVFHTLFYVNNGTDENTGAPDMCSVTLEEPACAMNNLMQDVVKVLQCADSTNLTLNPQTFNTITLRLTSGLNTLLNQLTHTNFSAPDSPFSDIFKRFNNPSPSNLQDEVFISTWFQTRLKPRLKHLDQNYLTCLSAKPFSCQTFQILVRGMSDNMLMIGEHDHMVYLFFITPFLKQMNSTAPCMNNSSSDWILRNLAGFSHLASVQEMYLLNNEFNALEALDVLTPRQLAELVVEDLPVLPEKKQVIDAVFDFALTTPVQRNLTEILHQIIILAQEMGMNCSSYQQIVKRLYAAAVPPELQQMVQDTIDTFSLISPPACLIPPPATCLSIPVNETLICAGVYSVEQLDSLLNVSCNNINLKQITCSQSVVVLSAEHLASLLTCTLSNNVTYSKELWKLLFIKLDGVLDDALRIFSSTALPWPINSESASHVLDAFADVRLERFSPDQWEDRDFLMDLFDHDLKPFLPFSSADLLYCFSSTNFTCSTFHFLVKEFSDQVILLDKPQKLRVLKTFLLPYLTKNTTDMGCVSSSNSSSDWLLMNFGSFAELLSVRELININPQFNPMLVLPSLTPFQTAELMVEDLPGLPDKPYIINTVFNFLRSSPWKLNLVLQELLIYSNKNMISCSSHNVISNKLFWALSFVPQDLQYQLYALATQLKSSAPHGCSLTPLPVCTITTVNESQLCEGFSRYSSDQLLQEVSNGSCSIPLQNYACSQLEGFTSLDLALLLSCSTSSEYSKEVWKLLFYKSDQILDQALLIFSNITGPQPLPRSPALANVLEVIGEVQLGRFTPDQWNDSAVLDTFFRKTLTPYLSSVSPEFLTCLMRRNLTCPTFQIIVQEFSRYFSFMNTSFILNEFILPVLLTNSDMGCVSSTNSSSDWLMMNLGQFAELLSVKELIFINHGFDPLLALSSLSPGQVAELMVMDVPGHSKDEVIGSVFDFLTQSTNVYRFPAVLISLISSTEMISCSSYKLIFTRLQHALLSVPAQVKPALWSTFDLLMQTAPAGCMPPELQCPVTLVNESEVCRNVDSSAVESFLNAGVSMESPCRFPILNYSCANLGLLTALQLTSLLQCKLGGNEVSPKEVWKLFFTKVSGALDDALYQLTQLNTDSIEGPNVPVVLEVIAEMKLNQFTPDKWTSGELVSDWLNTHLKPLLPSISGVFLYCLSSKNLTCTSYQNILPVFTQRFSKMNASRTELVLKYLIEPILTSNSTGGCVINNSADWLALNFGPFSQVVTVKQLMNINRNFNPILVLPSLTPLQTAELMVEDLPGLPDKSATINTVFNFLLQSPWERRLPEVLQSVSVLTKTMSPGCATYKIIFSRLEMILSSSPGALEPVIWASVYSLLHTAPPGCLLPVVNSQCLATPFNDTDVCKEVQSSVLDQYATNGTAMLPCHLTIPEYACARTLNITLDELLCVLKHTLTNNSSPASVPAWKLFLTRVSAHLDSALLALPSQVTVVNGEQASNFLDALREIRLDRFSANELLDEDFVRQWFGVRLLPLLPHSSSSFLTCLISRNLSCTTFHSIVQVFNYGFFSMDAMQQYLVAHEFMQRFLEGKSEPVCASNDSSQWIISNFGNFSLMFSVNDLINMNPNFRPLEALPYLSVSDITEMLVFDYPGSPPRDVVLNTIFDFLTASPRENRLTEVIEFLTLMADQFGVNISCSSYRIIFQRLDYLFPSVPVDMESVIVYSKSVLLKHLPPGCVIYQGQCNTTPANETTLCRGINSDVVYDSMHNNSLLCNSNITQYACAELSALLPDQLVKILVCNLHANVTVSDETWKLFITKANSILGPALDLLTNTTLPWSRPLVSVLDMIGEVTLSEFGSDNYRNSSFIQRWFQIRLRPFLPYASPHFLSCLASKDFSCDSFQNVIQIFSEQFGALSNNTAVSVYSIFIQTFLNRTTGCATGVPSSDWLSRYFGPFFNFASVPDLQRLNPSFNPLDVLDRLSLGQLVQVLTSPGLLTSSDQVDKLMVKVPSDQFFLFFTSLAGALQQGVVLPGPVRVALLQQVLDRVNLTVPESQMQVWVGTNLPPLISAITPQQIPKYFTIVQNTSCSISQQAVALLNSSSSSFSNDTLLNIYQEIISSLKGPEPLRCYRNQSFYLFLQSSFMGFQFPPLSVLLSIIPTELLPQMLSSMSPAELYSFLSRPGAVDDLTQLCQLFNNYQRIGEYLQNEPVVSEAVGRQTLSCVWSRALSASTQDEVDQWFNLRLVQYQPFLSSQLINSTQLSDASCLSFSKFVSMMGAYNYSNADFTKDDIYNTIREYLSTYSSPRCYNPLDPVLNSTSWFANYLGFFITFISLDDLDAFGGINLMNFTVDKANLKLFQQYSVDANVSSVYVEMLYEMSPSFNAALLPPAFRCFAPADGFTQLNSSESEKILESLNDYCSSIDSTVSAALAENMGTVTSSSISALGNSSTGLSTGQISSTSPDILNSSLNILSNVVGWNRGQTMTIINVLLGSGVFKITGSSSLLQLGTLVTGLPSTIFTSIEPTELLKSVQSQSFLTSITSAPSITQQTIVNQLIKLNSSSDAVVNMIPGTLATLIPRNSLLTVSASAVSAINNKTWKYEQAMLFFDTVAGTIDNEDTISPTVMQGFTSTRIKTFGVDKVRKLIRGCRRRNNSRITLQESQLTCMYNFIRTEVVTVFTDYPPELLLYYNYSLVNQSLCQDFFSALGFADFSVLSSTLSFRKQVLFNSALQCLNISSTSITRAQLEVLGNLTCMLNMFYIQDSDPYVLEKLKPCEDYTTDQIRAMENVLLTKNTTYGSPSNWTINTLNNLGKLPLYFSYNFWGQFSKKDKTQFMKTFLPTVRGNPRLSSTITSMLSEAQKVSKSKTRLSLRIKRDTGCTAGEITQVQASDNSFPFGYDATQFNVCLSVQSLKDNLASLSEKAVGSDFQRVILDKLNQAYPSSISDEVLQVLGPVSRAATVTDITKWNITKVDTLTALMRSSDGNWTAEQVTAIVNKYLAVKGNSLGSSELNAIGGLNLCSLDISILNTITASSLQSAGSLSVSTCSEAQKLALFSIAETAFSDKALNTTRASSTVSATAYQLIQNYLSGARLAYIQNLAASGISMDLLTFTSLNSSVVNALSVSEVKGLLGNANLPDLKRYENNSVVQNWVRLQLQSDLNTLGIGLTGGRADTVTTATTASTNTTANATANANATASTSGAAASTATIKPTGSGSRIEALPRLQLLVLFSVVMATLKLMH